MPTSKPIFSQRERAAFLALARTAIPRGRLVSEPTAATLDRLETQFSHFSPQTRRVLKIGMWALEMSPIAKHLRPFSRLKAPKRLAVLESWMQGNTLLRLAMRALLAPIKAAHFDNPELYQAMACRYAVETPQQAERARWKQNLVALPDLDADTELEADVVVVGTGAGGAVVAKELAERGLAVAMVEAGDYFDRRVFDGRPATALRRMYRGRGTVMTLGNAPIYIPSGRTVGGTTTINSGTCLRAPDRVLEKWRRKHGLHQFSPDALAPYFDRVESILGVEPAKPEFLGGCARVIARGCDALGYTRHGPLTRNAPECDGQGICAFGCPTDAKRSTNVSYVPLALRHHATLFYRARVKKILVEQGRARGVVAEGPVDRDGRRGVRRLTIRARAVVLSCGTYGTPALLLRNGLANSSGQLGRNLTLHPAVGVLADFDEVIDSSSAIPQGYAIWEFQDQKMMFEGGSTPLETTATALDLYGPALTTAIERFNHLAAFGVMVGDTSHGRVKLIRGDRPIVLYNLNRADMTVLKRGVAILAEIYFAAGARTVYPAVRGHEIIADRPALDRYRRARLHPRDFSLSAYHPLGTARMGVSRRSSVVGPYHEVFDVPGLFVIDGSSVPTSLSVNPQITIMAMSTRAAEELAARLS